MVLNPSASANLSVRFVAVNHELRISSATEFVQVHAHAFAVGIDAKCNHAVKQRIEQVDQRENHAEQRGNTHELREHLPRLWREEARGQQSPQAAHGVDRDGAGVILVGVVFLITEEVYKYYRKIHVKK